MELNTILNIMSDNNLTADELLLFYLTYISQSENGDPATNRTYFQKWYNGGGKERLRSLFTSLKDKGVIVKNYNPTEYNPDEIQLNQHFVKRYLKYTGELGQELLEHYPKSMIINGRVAYLDNITKKFIDVSDFYFWYSVKIKHNREKHNKILEILDWAASQNLVNFGILEFVGSQKWELFEEMRKTGTVNAPTTYEVYATV